MLEPLLLVVVGLNIWADFMDRRAARRSNIYALSLWTTIVQFLLVLPLIGLAHGITLKQLVLIAIVGAFSALARIPWFEALSSAREQLSRLAPVSRISSVLVLAFAFIVLGEEFTILKFIGACLLVLGAFIMTFDRGFTSFKDYLANNRALGLVLIFSVSTASVSILYKTMLNDGLQIITLYFYLKLFQLISIVAFTFHKDQLFNSYSSILDIKLFVKARAIQTVAAFLFIFVLRYLDLSVVEPIAAATAPLTYLLIEKVSQYRKAKSAGENYNSQPTSKQEKIKYASVAIIAAGLLCMVVR